MTEEPEFDSLSVTQLEALCDVAFGGTGRGFHPRTMESLTKRELIERVEREDRGGFGVFRWAEYVMPLSVHIRFCEWCAARPEFSDIS